MNDIALINNVPDDVVQLVRSGVKFDWVAQTPDGSQTSLNLPPEFMASLLEAMMRLFAGKPVTLMPAYYKCYVGEVAAFLNVRVSFVEDLFERGELPYSTDSYGTRFVWAKDLVAYNEKSIREGHAAVNEIMQLSQDMGLY